ncbi:hypothetical protein [Natrinema salifodinae]|nr:hypothetical protein [Natrinema salifodinae]
MRDGREQSGDGGNRPAVRESRLAVGDGFDVGQHCPDRFLLVVGSMTLEDLTDETTWEESLVSEDVVGWFVSGKDIIGTATDGTSVNLTAGHQYEARVRLEASTSTGASTGGATSDFGEHLDSTQLNNKYIDQK